MAANIDNSPKLKRQEKKIIKEVYLDSLDKSTHWSLCTALHSLEMERADPPLNHDHFSSSSSSPVLLCHQVNPPNLSTKQFSDISKWLIEACPGERCFPTFPHFPFYRTDECTRTVKKRRKRSLKIQAGYRILPSRVRRKTN